MRLRGAVAGTDCASGGAGGNVEQHRERRPPDEFVRNAASACPRLTYRGAAYRTSNARRQSLARLPPARFAKARLHPKGAAANVRPFKDLHVHANPLRRPPGPPGLCPRAAGCRQGPCGARRARRRAAGRRRRRSTAARFEGEAASASRAVLRRRRDGRAGCSSSAPALRRPGRERPRSSAAPRSPRLLTIGRDDAPSIDLTGSRLSTPTPRRASALGAALALLALRPVPDQAEGQAEADP